jgi:hypothetical protein
VLPRYPDSMIRELARFTKPRVPTADEKKKAHAQIMDLLTGDLPSWLRVDRTSDAEDRQLYTIFRDKLRSRRPNGTCNMNTRIASR